MRRHRAGNNAGQRLEHEGQHGGIAVLERRVEEFACGRAEVGKRRFGEREIVVPIRDDDRRAAPLTRRTRRHGGG